MTSFATAPPPLVVVMGVSGCGKSTVGQLLADRLGVPFVEGDALHPPENVERMARGIALTDEDRRGWLQALAQRIDAACDQQQQQQHHHQQGLVVSCSALKRAYREVLRAASPTLAFVHLHGSQPVIAARLAARVGHYMPASLLPSQFQILEVPAPDELALTLDVSLPPDTLAEQAAAWVQSQPTQLDVPPILST